MNHLTSRRLFASTLCATMALATAAHAQTPPAGTHQSRPGRGEQPQPYATDRSSITPHDRLARGRTPVAPRGYQV